MAKLKEGGQAPAFELPDRSGDIHTLQEQKEKFLVIYFYPKDSTPGCTIEAVEFNGASAKFKRAKSKVIGISGGNAKTKEKFCKQHDLDLLLLSDEDFSVAKAYSAYGPKVFMGKKFKGIFRMTFVLDQKRKVIKIFDKVKAEGHADEVLEFLKTKS